MTNVVLLMGRLTKDPELKTTSNGSSVISFTLAVERDYCAKGEERKVDFIKCTAWRNTADFISRYFGKGSLIAVQGSWQTNTYEDQNGEKHYSHFCNVEKASFTGERRDNAGGNNGCQQNGGNNGYQQNGGNNGYQQNGGNNGYQQNGGNNGYQQNGGNNGYQQNGGNNGYQQNGGNNGYQQNGGNNGYQQNGGNNGYQQNGGNNGYQQNGGNNGYQQNGGNNGYQQNGGNNGYQQNGGNNGYQNPGAFPDDAYPEDDDLPF